ncbi:MAG: hypothetical protein RL454_799 [Actinomycetota bacterium]
MSRFLGSKQARRFVYGGALVLASLLGISGAISSASAVTYCDSSKTISGSYTIETITATGACSWRAPASVTSVDADIVAGGGSGGVGMMGGGGGGGGQLVEVRTQTVTGGSSYPITVGAGGAAAAVVSTRVNGNNGADSSAFGYTAKGGLGGSGQDNGSNAGAPG